MTVRVRFAPSPTGEPHIGNVRTVVFNWLFARRMGGQFILRIEDTDRKRYKPATIASILDGLRWLGLDWDEGPSLAELRAVGLEDAERYAVGGDYGPYIQSQRLELYRRVAEQMVAQGLAYRCNCPPERLEQMRQHQMALKQPSMYDRHCRDLPEGVVRRDEPHVIRLKVPLAGQTVVHDLIKGDVVFDNSVIDDQVLLKSDGYPTYHLAVVVDDHEMNITHILRGDDWIPSEPKRTLIYEALGWPIPVYCHVPLVLGPDGKKLAKRHGATSISQFRSQGYLPEAVFNHLALLGWSPGEAEEQELFTREELIERFDLQRINRAPASFSYDKLDWLNGVYIRAMAAEDLLEHLVPFWQEAGLVATPCPTEDLPKLRHIVPLVQERLKRLTDVVPLTAFMFRDIEVPPLEKLVAKKTTVEQSRQALQEARKVLALVDPFDEATMEPRMRALADSLGLKAGQLFGIVRWATTGQEVAPPLFGSLVAIGREHVLRRLEQAEAVLASAALVGEARDE